MNAHPDDAARRRESDAILRRLRQEIEPQVGAASERIVGNARHHFGAGDVDQSDRIEVVGTRIGRWAGLAAFAALLIMFVFDHIIG